MSAHRKLPEAKIVGAASSAKNTLLTQVYRDRADTRKKRADLAARMRARVQGQPGQ